MISFSKGENIDYLYKFRAPNDYTLDILSKQKLRFSYPLEFNDPFDCRIRYTYKGEKQDWQQWFDEIKLSAKHRLFMENILKFVNYDETAFRKRMDMQTERLLILSLSEKRDHILLWSHYAESHKGVCFGFQTTTINNSIGIMFDEPALEWKWNRYNSPKGFLPAFKVNYTNFMPEPYSRFKDDDKRIIEFLITKHKDWHYEAERRLILPITNVSNRYLKYNKKVLKQIIFGCRIEDKYKQQVYHLAGEHFQGHHIEFYQAEPKEGEYSLILNRIN